VRRGAARPRAARRHSTRRICRPPPFFLPTRRLTDTRGLPPTDRYRSRARLSPSPPILLRTAAATVAAAGEWGAVGRRSEIWGGGEWDLKHVRQAAAASRLPSPVFTAAAARHSLTLLRSAASFRASVRVWGYIGDGFLPRGSRCDASTPGLHLRECPW